MTDKKPFVRACLRLILFVAIVVMTTAVWARPAAAQTLYGSITGNILDGTGAAVPGANISIKDEATGLELTGVTDSTGAYTIRNVTGGTYTLRATLQGFKEFVQTGIPIAAGSIVRINCRL